MRKSLAFLSLTAVLAAVPAALPAQASPTDSVALNAAIATLKSDLRNFVVAQERYFAGHMTYATSLREMGTTYQASAGVTLVLLTSSGRGHTEIAITDRVPGLVCGNFVGNGPPPLGMGDEGAPVCRGP